MALRRLFSICEIMSEQDELLKEEKTASGLEQDLLSPEPQKRESFLTRWLLNEKFIMIIICINAVIIFWQ